MQWTGLVGVLVLLAIAWLLSTDRRRVDWRLVGIGVATQFILAFLFLRFKPIVSVFDVLAVGVTKVISFANAGSQFIFGSLADDSQAWGFVFAVRVLPVIVFFAALMSALYHIGVMQRIVAGVAWVLRRTLGVTGAEALSAAANIFVGQTEAPLCIKPYIAGMTRSQIMAVMTGGFATIAGSVMAAYVQRLGGQDPQAQALFAKHLMTASVMSAPAGLVMAKIMLPERDRPREESLESLIRQPIETRNVLDALAAGATDGLKLGLNVAAMLVAFVAVLALLNWPITELGKTLGFGVSPAVGLPITEPLSLERLLGWAFTPLAWVLGVPRQDCGVFGSLLGQQLIATEFVAYMRLSEAIHPASGDPLISARTAQIATYSLCGFANFPSIAIQIGGLSAIAPERRADFAALGLRAMTAGALACWMTGAVAGVLIPA